jgi:hypothetical protein
MHCCGRVFPMLNDGARTELETWRIALSRLDEKQPHCQELPFVYEKSKPILNTDSLEYFTNYLVVVEPALPHITTRVSILTSKFLTPFPQDHLFSTFPCPQDGRQGDHRDRYVSARPRFGMLCVP